MLYFSHSLTLLTFCQCYWFRSLMNLVGNFVGTAFVQFKTKKQADECIRVSSSFQVNGHFFWFWIIVMVFLGLFVIIHGISWKKWCRKRKLFVMTFLLLNYILQSWFKTKVSIFYCDCVGKGIFIVFFFYFRRILYSMTENSLCLWHCQGKRRMTWRHFRTKRRLTSETFIWSGLAVSCVWVMDIV